MNLKEWFHKLVSFYKRENLLVNSIFYGLMVGVATRIAPPLGFIMIAWWTAFLFSIRHNSSFSSRYQSVAQKSRQRKNKLRQLTKVHSEYKIGAEFTILQLQAKNKQLQEELDKQ